MAEYKIIKMEGRAKRAEFKTVHGTVQTGIYECGNCGCH